MASRVEGTSGKSGGSVVDPTGRPSGPRTDAKSRGATAEGRNGKLPWGRRKKAALIAPLAAVVVAGSTLWAIPHVEDRVERETRSELEAAGIDTEGLEIDARYRFVDVRGASDEAEADRIAAVERFDGTEDLNVFFGTGGTSGAVSATTTDAPTPTTGAPVTTVSPTTAAPVTTAPATTAAPTTSAALEPLVGSTEVVAVVTADGVVLSGEVVNEEQRGVLVDAAIGRFGEGNVDDRLVILGADEAAEGADEGVASLAAVLAGVPDGVIGTASLSDADLGFEGSASDAAAAEEMSALIEGSGGSAMVEVEVNEDNGSGSGDDSDLASGLADMSDELMLIRFAPSQTVLSQDAMSALDQLAELINATNNGIVDISGHTCSMGGLDYNQALSERRAASVFDHLVGQGVDAERLSTRGAGELDPIASNDTAEGRAQNRRVSIDLIDS
ncbi:MAG: outer membrane protein OmpA-like peptidoglycan-associated protein [Candidatus Poriferisodalaceae bacterium]|jgi:outer membrane protein OmpA-like peptidoglycan-associated protein